MTGPALGRPKSATFRTMDIAGHRRARRTCATCRALTSDRRVRCRRSSTTLIERGWVGEKAGRASTRTRRRAAEILTLDPATLDVPPEAAGAAAVARSGARDRRHRRADPDAVPRHGQGRTNSCATTLGPTLALRGAGRAGDRPLDRRRRSRDAWGFGWELGPFEIWDAIGVREVLDAIEAPASAAVAAAASTRAQPVPGGPPADPSADSEVGEGPRSAIVATNAGASLVDLGDGVLAVEFHSKMNAIGGDTIADAAGRRQGSGARTSRRSSSATTRRTSPPAPT